MEKLRTLSRREFALLSAAGALGGTLGQPAHALAQAVAAQGADARKIKSCILVWLPGGVSQGHTWDVKPGGYPSIQTTVPGIRIADCMPQLAQQMRHLTLLRSMNTGTENHQQAFPLMARGFRASATPYPSLGCMAQTALGDPRNELPNHIVLDCGAHGGGGNDLGAQNLPGYLGAACTPLIVQDPSQPPENFVPTSSLEALRRRMSLLEQSEDRFQRNLPNVAGTAHLLARRQAMQMLSSVKASAFDLEREPAAVRAAYGEAHKFGKACLLARRLVENGVPIVQLRLQGWDDHGGPGGLVRQRFAYMDPALASLLRELHDRRLLDTTLVVIWSEFGRNPPQYKQHHAKGWTAVLAGGGLKTGQVVGATTDDGTDVKDRPISAGDFFATIYTALGVDLAPRRINPGSIHNVVDRGAQAIREVL